MTATIAALVLNVDTPPDNTPTPPPVALNPIQSLGLAAIPIPSQEAGAEVNFADLFKIRPVRGDQIEVKLPANTQSGYSSGFVDKLSTNLSGMNLVVVDLGLNLPVDNSDMLRSVITNEASDEKTRN